MIVKEVKSMALVKDSEENIELLKRRLFVKNIHKDYQLPLYKETDSHNHLLIPVALVKQPVDNADWETFSIKHKIKLRPIQQQIVNDFIAYIESSPSGGIIQAGTGSGKTIMGLWLACYFGLKTLIIAPTDRIYRQWLDRCKSFTNIERVGVIRGNVCDYDAPITIAMLHTIRKDKFDYLEKEFGLVIYDEIHTISTLHFNSVASKFWCKLRLGLSATPYRKDGMQNIFFYHIGNLATKHTQIDVIPKFIVVKYYDPATYHEKCMWGGKLNIGRYFNCLTQNQNRNIVIAKYIRLAHKQNHNILLLTDRIEHIRKLILLSGLPKEDVGKLTQDAKDIDKKVIFGTYGSAGLGLDIPSLTCLILATPRADIIQAVGRVTRAKVRTPIVIDFVDEANSAMNAWYRKREKYYKNLSKDIIYVREG